MSRVPASLALALAVAAAAAWADGAPTTPKKDIPMESAKRRIPTVQPVVHQGVRYEPLRRAREHGFNQGGGVVAATEVATGQRRWAVQLYETPFDPKEERDVQEIYVTELKLAADGAALLATDERRRQWRIELSDGRVSAQPAASR